MSLFSRLTVSSDDKFLMCTSSGDESAQWPSDSDFSALKLSKLEASTLEMRLKSSRSVVSDARPRKPSFAMPAMLLADRSTDCSCPSPTKDGCRRSRSLSQLLLRFSCVNPSSPASTNSLAASVERRLPLRSTRLSNGSALNAPDSIRSILLSDSCSRRRFW